MLFPDWLQTALLTVLLLFVINKTVRKGIRQWGQESKAIKQRHQDAEEASTGFPPFHASVTCAYCGLCALLSCCVVLTYTDMCVLAWE